MRRKAWLIAAIAVLLIIWCHSALPVSQSARESGWFTKHVVTPVLQWFGLAPVSGAVVRKAAHVFEFTVLGLCTAPLWEGHALKTVGTGLLAAFLDESIQVLSARGPAITDVWIDLIGVVLGTAAGCFLVYLRRRRAADPGIPRRPRRE